MRDMPSRFIEILDPKDTIRVSVWDVRLEDVLAHQEAVVTRSRSSTQSSGKGSLDKDSDRENGSPPSQRWKRISNILSSRRSS
ncbi:hypothetical protein PHISCL_05642 [Aspergillus sclerotialis]|uniref:Uncharacterized protein n=1 Tax=Aspergillus sclerotialis TaxID=2070753 RepID=A0A3A2ZKV3_9EURO|nr:hypothetical protein PHISCL_05642 [Aspergillus sclerotialis]